MSLIPLTQINPPPASDTLSPALGPRPSALSSTQIRDSLSDLARCPPHVSIRDSRSTQVFCHLLTLVEVVG